MLRKPFEVCHLAHWLFSCNSQPMLLCSTIAKIKRICRHYDQLHPILVDRAQSQAPYIADCSDREKRKADRSS